MEQKTETKTNNHKFLKGTLILTISSIVVKVIGSLNRIILSRVMGGEGIGLYQMGFPIYLMAITVSSAGIPVAISIITAEKLAQKDFLGAQRVFHISLRLLLVTGLVFSGSLLFGAGWLIDNHPDQGWPQLLFNHHHHHSLGTGCIFCYLSFQFSGISAGLADYDTYSCFRNR